MLTLDKLTIRYNKFVKNLLLRFVYWNISFGAFIFISGNTQLFFNYLDLLKVENIYIIIPTLSLGLAVLFCIIDLFFTDRLMRFFPIGLTMLLRLSIYFVSTFVLILIAIRYPIDISGKINLVDLLKVLPKMDIHFIRFLVHFYTSCILLFFLREMHKKMGHSNLRRWIVGLLNKPREEKRIFMFIDMKASTTIAERLEHKKFSHLVQDVFNDFSVVDNYKAEIYQYLGDGAIVSWSLKRGLHRHNCLQAFYAFTHVINKRKNYYTRKYNLVPQFKAGIHVGKIMVLQIGQIRRDISYNGDTLNTTARIESMCNEYRQNLLISGDLFSLIKETKRFAFKNVGNIKLKGKRKAVDIYQVKQK
ncbi:MAG: adenylate/guanylate cyclase domain-containing protein [Bacteroidales bacterium]|nr:adenylate/guanylate cyclase domain-containing protein [Bacteroidales bacterium]